jgi:prevent-host-death family protein
VTDVVAHGFPLEYGSRVDLRGVPVQLFARGPHTGTLRDGTVTDLHEAEAQLLELVERAAAGEEILIARNGVPVARLVPLEAGVRRRLPGGWEHGVHIADDFDAPLP